VQGIFARVGHLGDSMNKLLQLSLAAGVIGCCGVLSGAAQENRPAVQGPPPQGRFVIFFSPLARADAYLVDTESGRVWSQVTFTDVEGDPKVWVPQTRVDSEAELLAWELKQTLKAAKK